MLWLFLGLGVSFLVGVIVGQLTVWRMLRRRTTVQIGDWEYTAIKIFKLGKKGGNHEPY
ncbi:hypothetical protein ES703_93929 [subsurface metagenome]